MPTRGQLLIHLLVATGLAGVLGVERELSEQPAGFRTHMLVGVGSALFAVVSAFGFQAIAGEGPIEVVRADVTRVASQIVVGIGFLGGGAILKYGASVKGLTTAASLWVTAAVGTAAGLGMLLIAAATTGIALLALGFLRPIRALIRRYAPLHVEFVIEADRGARLGAVTGELRQLGAKIGTVRVDDEVETRSFTLMAQLPKGLRPDEVANRLTETQHIRAVDWSR